MLDYVIQLIASFFAVVIVLTLHEFSHAFVAYKCGDPTPKFSRRLTLNPLRHFDIVGLLCFTFVGFGWAKPVPINPNNFKKYRSGLALTSSAGVIMNYITAFVFFPLFMVVLNFGGGMPDVLGGFFYYFTLDLFSYSLSFCVFNLLPFHPLDGFNLIDALSRRRRRVLEFLRKYGYYILLALVVESFVCRRMVDGGIAMATYFDVLGWIMKFATNIFGYPIVALWNLLPWNIKIDWRIIPWL